MKICFFSPYFPHHFGGGEKHLLDVALAAAQHHSVEIAIPMNVDRKNNIENHHTDLGKVRQMYQEFYGESLEKIKFIFTPLGTRQPFLKKLLWTKNYDALYYVSDGSLFFSLAKRNYLHIQIPFTQPLSLLDRIKLLCWRSINTNSAFTKRIIEQSWQLEVSLVLHPMVDMANFKNGKKEKIILNVGRFFRQLHSKRQDILVEIFKKLVDQNPHLLKGWKLYLAGNVEDQKYFEEIKKSAKGYAIAFFTDLNRAQLFKLYQHARLYWHATGFEVHEEAEPSRVEHFGITTIEAMAAGAVPLVVGKGGQREVLGELYPELNWTSREECVAKTLELIEDHKKIEELEIRVKKQAAQFSKEEFSKKVFALFSI